MPDKFRICFVAPKIYPMLARVRDIPLFGGAEFRQTVLARAFAAAGHEVSVVTLDLGQEQGQLVDGVRVLKTHLPDEGIPVIRYLYPRLTSVAREMTHARADIYFQASASHLTALVAWHCRRTGAVSVYLGASETDFMRGQERLAYARDRWLFRWGIANVDAIIAQTPHQAGLLKDHYGREAVVIANPYQPPPRARAQHKNVVLWVGGIRKVKRPDRFIALARLMPQYRFCMIGGVMGEDAASHDYFSAIRHEASSVANMEVLGYVPLEDVEPWFDEARVFINTSEHEGFPNTFLQAWARGIPTVSYFDAGAAADGSRPFALVRNEAEAQAALGRLMDDGREWSTLSQRCMTHFNAHHSTDRVIEEYLQLFDRLVQHRQGRV